MEVDGIQCILFVPGFAAHLSGCMKHFQNLEIALLFSPIFTFPCLTPFTDEETETQGGEGICPGSHCWSVAELELDCSHWSRRCLTFSLQPWFLFCTWRETSARVTKFFPSELSTTKEVKVPRIQADC